MSAKINLVRVASLGVVALASLFLMAPFLTQRDVDPESVQNHSVHPEIDTEIDQALHALDPMDRNDKSKLVDAIIYYIWRNYRRSANAFGSNPSDIMSAKDAQCQGRVMLASWLLDRLGIRSRMITIDNIGGGAHSVIEVEVDGKYVVFDLLSGGFFTESGEVGSRRLSLASIWAAPDQYIGNLVVPCGDDKKIVIGGDPDRINLPGGLNDVNDLYCQDKEGAVLLGMNQHTLKTPAGNGYYYQASLINGAWYPLDYVADIVNFTNGEKAIGIIEQTHTPLDYDELSYANRSICNIDTQKSIKVINYPTGTKKIVLALSTVPPRNYAFGYREIGSFNELKHVYPKGQNLEINIEGNVPGSAFVYPDVSYLSTCIFIDSIYIE